METRVKALFAVSAILNNRPDLTIAIDEQNECFYFIPLPDIPRDKILNFLPWAKQNGEQVSFADVIKMENNNDKNYMR